MNAEALAMKAYLTPSKKGANITGSFTGWRTSSRELKGVYSGSRAALDSRDLSRHCHSKAIYVNMNSADTPLFGAIPT